MNTRMRNMMAAVILAILLTSGAGLADLNDGLIAYYPFEGNADDVIGGYNGIPHADLDFEYPGHTGTSYDPGVQHGNIDYGEGVIGQAAYFDGDDVITVLTGSILSFPANQQKTIACWFKSSLVPYHDVLFGGFFCGYGCDKGVYIALNRWGIGTAGIHLRIGWQTAPGYETVPPMYSHEFGENYDDETWHHVAVIRDSDGFDVYIDAQYVDSMSIDISYDIKYGEGSTIGGAFETNRGHFTYGLAGAIDELRVYNRVLSEDDINELINSPPVANAGPDQTVEQSSTIGAEVQLDGSESSDPDGDILTYDWTWWDEGPVLVSCVQPLVTLPPGMTVVTLTVSDGFESDADTVQITVVDTTPPVITLNGDSTITLECGIDVYEELGATAFDICDPAVSVVIGGDTVDTSTCGTYIVTYNATDSIGNAAIQVTRTVKVEDTLSPEIISAIVEPQVVQVGQPVNFNALISDECGFTVEWDFGDGNPDSIINPTTHSYDFTGIYIVTLTATDTSGNFNKEEFIVVVYDVSDGFVTGGGWIWSPAGALRSDPYLEGKANFGFVSKYKKGATEPTGQTEFVFQAGDLNFHSSSYDWLVVAGPKAMFKGVGTINGAGNYGFMLSAVDAALTPSTSEDRFRIKIWDKNASDAVVYDNQIGDDDNADVTTAIGGGSIVIHAK